MAETFQRKIREHIRLRLRALGVSSPYGPWDRRAREHTESLLGCSVEAFAQYISDTRKKGMRLRDFQLLWTIESVKPLQECISAAEHMHFTNQRTVWKQQLAYIPPRNRALATFMRRLLLRLKEAGLVCFSARKTLRARVWEDLFFTIWGFDRTAVNREALRVAMWELGMPLVNRASCLHYRHCAVRGLSDP